MKTLFRILGTAAAVAVTGAAIVALDKILNQKDPLHVEEVEFPEDAEQNAEEAAKTAEAYAEAETKASRCCQRKGCRRSCAGSSCRRSGSCCPARRRSLCPGGTRGGR